MTATLQPTQAPSTETKFDIATLCLGQVLTLECGGGNKWFISLTDESRQHSLDISGVMVMTSSTNRGYRTARPPGEISVGRFVIVGQKLRINFNYTEKVLRFSVSKSDSRP